MREILSVIEILSFSYFSAATIKVSHCVQTFVSVTFEETFVFVETKIVSISNLKYKPTHLHLNHTQSLGKDKDNGTLLLTSPFSPTAHHISDVLASDGDAQGFNVGENWLGCNNDQTTLLRWGR